MTNEIIKTLTEALSGVIVFEHLTFIQSKKFNNDEKALYLIFAAHNVKLNKTQRITYDVAHRNINIILHTIHI